MTGKAALNSDSIIFTKTNPLKAILRSIHRLMQTSGGTEALRNLVDSDLPRLIKRIFEASKRFGSKVYALGEFTLYRANLSHQHHGNIRSQ